MKVSIQQHVTICEFLSRLYWRDSMLSFLSQAISMIFE